MQKIENDTERASRSKSAPGPKKAGVDQRMPQRPGYGTQGKAVMLWANYFEMMTHGDLLLHRYGIDILADAAGKVPAGKRLKRIVELLIEDHYFAHRNSIATDYKSNLICRSELPMEEETYTVVYRAEDEDEPAQNAKTYRLRLQDTGTLRVSELVDYLTSTRASALFGSKDEIIQALNIVVGHHPKTASNIVSVGANKHFPLDLERMSLGAGLQAMRGFFVSVRAVTSRILVNVQVKHAACYNEGPLTRSMSAYLDQNIQNKFKLQTFLKRVRVRVTHIVKKNKKGQEIPRIKTIAAFATPGDGQGLEKPPLVPRFGAGAKDVKFFLGRPGEQGQPSDGKDGKKGKKKGKAGPEPPSTGYISVYDFFRSSKCRSHSVCLGMSAADMSISLQYHRPGSQLACYQCRHAAEPVVLTCRSLHRPTWAARCDKTKSLSDTADDQICSA